MIRRVSVAFGVCLLVMAAAVGIGGRKHPPHSLAYVVPHGRTLTLHIDGHAYPLAVNPYGQRSTPAPVVASPDGEWLAFAVYSEIYKVRRDGTALQRLTTLYPSDFWLVRGLAWSADSQQLLASLASPAFEKPAPPRRSDLTPDPSTKLARGAEDGTVGSPSPFQIERGLGGEVSAPQQTNRVVDGVFIVETDGSGFHLVTLLPYGWTAPAIWTPDNEWVIFANHTGIHRIRPDGSASQSLYASDTFKTVAPLEMSPDGQWVAASGEKGQLLMIRSDGGQMVQPNVAGVRNLAWSPDGHCLAYVADGAVWFAGPDRLPMLFQELGDTKSHALLWSPDSLWLGWMLYSPLNNTWALEQVQVESRERQSQVHQVSALAWAPPVARQEWHGRVWAALGLLLTVGGVRWWRRA